MRKTLSLILSLIFLLQIVSTVSFATDEAGSPKHITRVVSVVFDDSGSMYDETDRWAYASYAMQAFTAMMGSDDVLYISYINASPKSERIDLSDSVKQNNVNMFFNMAFGGSTKNKLDAGVSCLKNEYQKHGTDAKYYLVVMADGQLDAGQGDYSEDLPKKVNEAKQYLAGADFEAHYFYMGEDDSVNIKGVTNRKATSGTEIVEELRDISADIMGLTDITKDCSVSGGKFSFDLKYPAFGITLFVQKNNFQFKDVKIPVQKDGKNASCDIDTYYVDCPTSINKSDKRWEEKIPTNPPSGFVSLVSDGDVPLAKGKYTLDLSALNVDKDDIVILVEPAVKVGCRYFIGDDEEAKSFSEIKDSLRVGDKVVVRCGLYEINSDGSLGEAVPDDVLSPEYKLYVNDSPITKQLSGEKDAYVFEILQEYENKELKIEASLEGYRPFLLRERFGKFVIKPIVLPGFEDTSSEVTLTKPEWKDWLDGKKTLEFPLKEADASLLEYLSIKIDGYDGLGGGACLAMGDSISVKNNTVYYTPRFADGADFASLPESFSVSLTDDFSGEVIMSIKINVVQPVYKIEIENGLEGEDFGLSFLKNNTKAIRFILLADYKGDGVFASVGDGNCENDISFAVNSGSLPGEITDGNGEISFVPRYDAEVNTDVSPSEIIGVDHSVFATATVDGTVVESQKITFSVNNISYRLNVDNPIHSAFTLDTIKNNTQKILFSIEADYIGNGDYTEVADWDTSVYDKLGIDSGKLPGKTELEYDASGRIIGKSFTPLYDENNNNGIVFTEVAGKIHTVIGAVEQYSIQNQTTVEVIAPEYDVEVRKDGLELVDIELKNNNEGVEFTILRNDRPLSSEEIAGLAPYDLTLSKNQKSIKLKTLPMENSDGSGYLLCVPGYVHPSLLLNWTSLFCVRDGDMEIRLALGDKSAAASINIGTSGIAWIIFLIVLGIILLILWIWFCYTTRARFLSGKFYRATLKLAESGYGWVVYSCTSINANSGAIKRFFRGSFLRPFAKQKRSFILSDHSANFETVKDGLMVLKTYPHWKPKDGFLFNVGRISDNEIIGIINEEMDEDNGIALDDTPQTKQKDEEIEFKMDHGQYLCESNAMNNEKTIIFFVTKRRYRELFLDN